MSFLNYSETGQADPLGDLLGDVISGGAVQSGITNQLVAQLEDPQVRAQLRAAARPVMLEAAAYMFAAVALAMILFRK